MLKKLNEKKDQKKKKNLIQVVISPTTLAQLSMMNNNSFVIPIIVKDDVLHIQSSLTVGTWMTPKEQTQHYYQSMVWGADDSGANDADKKSKMKKKRTNDNYVVESWMFGNIHVGMVTGPYFEYNNNNNSSSSSTTTATDNSNNTTTTTSSSSSSVVTAVLPLVHAEYYPTVGIERMDQIDAMKTWMCTRLLFSLFTIIYLLLYVIFICTTF